MGIEQHYDEMADISRFIFRSTAKNKLQMSSMLLFSKLITVLMNERFRLRHTFNQCFYVGLCWYLRIDVLRLADVSAGQVFVQSFFLSAVGWW